MHTKCANWTIEKPQSADQLMRGMFEQIDMTEFEMNNSQKICKIFERIEFRCFPHCNQMITILEPLLSVCVCVTERMREREWTLYTT